MKSEKGITLISLTIYIIVMSIMTALISIISNFFYTNINDITYNIEPITQYTKFNSLFSDEVNHSNIKVLQCKNNYISSVSGENINFIVFDNGVQYEYIQANKAIYRNTVKICKNVNKCTFEYVVQNGKDLIIVTLDTGNKEQKMNFTLRN